MATLVGTETDLNQMLTHLVRRELDMVAACDEAASHLAARDCRERAETFREVHRRQAEELSQFLITAALPIPSRGDLKRLLARGKVMMANLGGDRAVLRAMRSNEDDLSHAYSRAINHPDASPSLRDVLRHAASSQRHHCEWIDRRLRQPSLKN